MRKQFEHFDVVTGEVFKSPTENHYEHANPIPLAPGVTTPRLSLRERIERMLYTPQDPNSFVADGTSETDFEEFGDDPLTESEASYIAQNTTLERFEAERLAKATLPPASPLPDPLAATPPANPPAEGPSGAPSPAKAP